MSKLNKLINLCKENKDTPAIKEMLNDFSDLSERTIKLIYCSAKLKIRGIQEVTKILEGASEEEVENAIMSFWFELRSEWMRYNAVNNYNMVMNGTADSMSVILSSYYSGLVIKLEEMLEKDQIEKMHEIMIKVQYS